MINAKDIMSVYSDKANEAFNLLTYMAHDQYKVTDEELEEAANLLMERRKSFSEKELLVDLVCTAAVLGLLVIPFISTAQQIKVDHLQRN